MTASISFHGPYEFEVRTHPAGTVKRRPAAYVNLEVRDGDGNSLGLFPENREQAKALLAAAIETERFFAETEAAALPVSALKAGRSGCEALNPDPGSGLICTAIEDHGGPVHVAYGIGGEVCGTWPQNCADLPPGDPAHEAHLLPRDIVPGDLDAIPANRIGEPAHETHLPPPADLADRPVVVTRIDTGEEVAGPMPAADAVAWIRLHDLGHPTPLQLVPVEVDGSPQEPAPECPSCGATSDLVAVHDTGGDGSVVWYCASPEACQRRRIARTGTRATS